MYICPQLSKLSLQHLLLIWHFICLPFSGHPTAMWHPEFSMQLLIQTNLHIDLRLLVWTGPVVGIWVQMIHS